ncbi:HEPN domain-containing protein [Acidianus ambivalens]|uniref:HEPN domain-containing protein n=1 Tax=Acidianus ambivalens TaxID=2283 RepID=A0A650CTY6_ACIAM|nr:HEPN domain-containing protein [Acidianus ambivalens]MQL56126.1 HEPN domain-containing protein [Acidianus ambivalens]QGR21331.1 HEPN domain-containing protein [Acidianus ambivalens]
MSELIEKGKQSFTAGDDAINKGYYWLACFLFHQSVELAIKGLLEITRNEHPYTHNLVELLKYFNPPDDILTCAMNLNPHYISSRYSLMSFYSRNDALNCKKNAEVILKWLKIF